MHGESLAGLLVTNAPPGRPRVSTSTFKPFLRGDFTKSGPQRGRTVTVSAVRPRPRVLAVDDVQGILDACQHLRDRLLFGLLLDTGLRVGEVLGLRHEDLMIAERQVLVVPRRNDNGARAKSGRRRTVTANADVLRLYADYPNAEYGALDSDYVFVNLFGRPHGQPLGYAAVYDLVRRLRRCTGITFGPHMFRHTYATWLLRRGAGMESVKELLRHASITTTVDTYGHLTVEDARRASEAAGWFTGREVRL